MGKKRIGKLLVTGAAAAAATVALARKQKQQKEQGQKVTGPDVNEAVKKMKDKVEELQVLASNATAESRENLKVTIGNVKGDAVNHAEAFKRKAERSKSKLSSELLKAQMNFEVQKEKFDNELAQRKYNSQKEKEAVAAKSASEDAAIMMDFALEMVEKATAASLEATKLVREYKEKYKEDLLGDTEEEKTQETDTDEPAGEEAEAEDVDTDDFAD